MTVDAFGTLFDLPDPAPALAAELGTRGVVRDPVAVARAFAAEATFYLPRAVRGTDPTSLAALRRDCAAVFLSELEAELDPDEFAPAFVGALDFRVVAGAREALGALRGAGLSLACVANWDVSLFGWLERTGLDSYFATIVSSAEVGAQKPDPRIFELALMRIGVDANRALHIGDSDADREGAHAAGLAFEPTPLATLPERLGLA